MDLRTRWQGQISHLKGTNWLTQARRPRGRGEAQEEVGICIGVSHNESTNITSMDCQLGNPCYPLRIPAFGFSSLVKVLQQK
ncbi:hypothetical protein Tco_0096966 [Tanacetum coccineum]